MTRTKSPIARPVATLAIVASLALSAPSLAQSSGQQDPHHPAARTAPAPTAGGGSPAGGAPSMTMHEGDMMMGMMRRHATAMAEMAMPGMAMTERIEGRIAFLKAELKITDAQAPHWEHLARALRDNARKLGELRAAMRQRAESSPPALAQRLEEQEQWFSARLDGLREIKTALSHLHASLSDEQKATADLLLAPHLGLMPMSGMSMMGAMPMMGGGPALRGSR